MFLLPKFQKIPSIQRNYLPFCFRLSVHRPVFTYKKIDDSINTIRTVPISVGTCAPKFIFEKWIMRSIACKYCQFIPKINSTIHNIRKRYRFVFLWLATIRQFIIWIMHMFWFKPELEFQFFISEFSLAIWTRSLTPNNLQGQRDDGSGFGNGIKDHAPRWPVNV